MTKNEKKAFSQFFLELVDQTLRGLQTSFSEGRALEKDLCPIGQAAYVHPAAMPVAEPLRSIHSIQLEIASITSSR